jgi:hypothetical protein
VVDLKATCTGEEPVDKGCVHQLESRPLHDSLVFSPDGRWALSYISQEAASSSQEEVINLNEVGIYDLYESTSRFSALGFNPLGFAFTQALDAPRAVVITDSRVIAVDLLTGEAVPRELTLGADTRVTPSQVVITPDDHYALVTMKSSADLYTFDLMQETLPINIISLSGVAQKMTLSSDQDATLITTESGWTLDIVHHADFSVDAIPLEAPVNTLVSPAGMSFSMLYDVAAGRVKGYLLDNPTYQVQVSPRGDAIVIYYQPESSSGQGSLDGSHSVAILNLTNGDRQPNPILVPSAPGSSAFVTGAEPILDQVFVGLEGQGHGLIAGFNLATYDSRVVEVPPHPRSIGRLEDGRIVAVHDAVNGLLSVFPAGDPGKVQFVSGFANTGLF